MRVIALCSLLLLAGCANAATLRLQATAPATLNAGSCSVPMLSPAPSSWAMYLHFAWSGPSAGEDSVSCLPGEPVTFTRAVIAGTYTVRAWPSNIYGAGCDTTISRTIGDPPARIAGLR